MSETDENEPSDRPESGDQGPLPGFLVDPAQETRDLKLLERAIRNRWPINDEHRSAIVNRLLRIVDKDEVTVMTKMGPAVLEEPADKNSVAAARVLVAMVGQCQADEHIILKTPEPAGSTTINIGAIGSISMGQEPLTPTDAKLQAEDILQRVLSRTKQPEVVRVVKNKSDDLSSL